MMSQTNLEIQNVLAFKIQPMLYIIVKDKRAKTAWLVLQMQKNNLPKSKSH